MISIFGKKFAQNESEAVESLFDPTGTISGFCKVYKRKILFMNLQKEPIAFINSHGVLGNAFVLNGSIHYQAALSSSNIIYSGSLLSISAEVESIAKGRDRLGLYFN